MSVKIGLIGFGTVAKGFYHILQTHGADMDVQVKNVAVKRGDVDRGQPELRFQNEPELMVIDPDISVIIELIDDAEVAYELVAKALSSGKAVISANKKMLAENLADVHYWHRIFKGPLLYEGAVGGGIPILNSLDRNFGNAQIQHIRAILNGSANFMLTHMLEKGWSYEEALTKAQALGFAESDPTLDVEGYDAAYKLQLLAYHAMGIQSKSDEVHLQSLTDATPDWLRAAASRGNKIKQVAKWSVDGQMTVGLEEVGRQDPLYHLDGEQNGVWLDTSLSGGHFFTGKGAGAFPTGLAVFNDLRFLLEGYRYHIPVLP